MTALAPPAAPPTGQLADLILSRLLPATKSRPSAKQIHADLAGLFRRPPAIEDVSAALETLRADGLLEPRGRTLTAAGRERALAYLGVAELPPRSSWKTVRTNLLVAKALGLSHLSAAEFKKVNNREKLAAMLLKRHLDLPVGTPTTLNATLEAAACQMLGFGDCFELKSIKPRVLAKAVGDDRPRTMKELQASLPLALLGATGRGLDGLRAFALAGRFDEPTAEPEVVPPAMADEEPFDLAAFARTVRAAARLSPTGRFGENKVFISHVWRELQAETPFAPLGLDGFKAKLLDANRERLLTLSRADLVQMMDPADVRESETGHGTGAFHFVLVEGD